MKKGLCCWAPLQIKLCVYNIYSKMSLMLKQAKAFSAVTHSALSLLHYLLWLWFLIMLHQQPYRNIQCTVKVHMLTNSLLSDFNMVLHTWFGTFSNLFKIRNQLLPSSDNANRICLNWRVSSKMSKDFPGRSWNIFLNM